MTIKPLASAMAAVATIGVAAGGVTHIASVTQVTPKMQMVVFGAPIPQQPTLNLPTPGWLIHTLNSFTDPNIPFADKSGLMESGLEPFEAQDADKKLQKAAQEGRLPLSFEVANMAPSGPAVVAADVTASGPQLPTRQLKIRLADQAGWKLKRYSAMLVLWAAWADSP